MRNRESVISQNHSLAEKRFACNSEVSPMSFLVQNKENVNWVPDRLISVTWNLMQDRFMGTLCEFVSWIL